MEGRPPRDRAQLLVIPLAASMVGVGLMPIVENDARWTPWSALGLLLCWLFLVGLGAVPAVVLTALRTRWGWVVALFGLTAMALAVPLSVAASDSSTRGLAFIIPIFYGVPAALALVLLERLVTAVSARRRGLARSGPR